MNFVQYYSTSGISYVDSTQTLISNINIPYNTYYNTGFLKYSIDGNLYKFYYTIDQSSNNIFNRGFIKSGELTLGGRVGNFYFKSNNGLNLNLQTISTPLDIIGVNYSINYDKIYVINIGGILTDEGRCMLKDNEDNYIILGDYNSSSIAGTGGLNVERLNSYGILIAKYKSIWK